MLVLTNGLYLLCLVLWVGSTLFFTLVVAPTLFSTLPVEAAGTAVSIVFPYYYAIAGVCGLVLLVLLVLQWRRTHVPTLWRQIVLVALMWLGSLYAGLVVQPRAAALKAERNAGGEGAVLAAAEFQRVHRIAMGLNTVVLLGGIALVAATAGRLRD